MQGVRNVFIRKKTYVDLLDKLDEIEQERDMYARRLATITALKKSHNPGPLCEGCKNLIKDNYYNGTPYHCKLDRGCKDYTEE